MRGEPPAGSPRRLGGLEVRPVISREDLERIYPGAEFLIVVGPPTIGKYTLTLVVCEGGEWDSVITLTFKDYGHFSYTLQNWESHYRFAHVSEAEFYQATEAVDEDDDDE
jgi:hypothetical protein